MEGNCFGSGALGHPRLVFDMGILINGIPVYVDAHAIFWWPSSPNRSAVDVELLLGAARVRRLVFEVLHPDDEPPALEPSVSWAIDADRWLVLWNGGRPDRP